MTLSRRQFLGAAAALPLGAGVTSVLAGSAAPLIKLVSGDNLRQFGPLRFAQSSQVNLNAGSSHPVSYGALESVQEYLQSRAGLPEATGYRLPARGPIEKFARLINAEEDELTYVQSTTTGEQMILRALGIPQSGGHIITDTLHFFGSLPMYRELEKQGMQVTFIREQNGRISPQAIKDAIRSDTRLISLSLVSTVNGFTHDLKEICDIAHSHGVLVFADIIHAAGCIPLNVKESGVDFASTASYKWLMGDFGLGFIFAARHTHDILQQSNYGYYGMARFQSHMYPHDEPAEHVVDYAFANDTNGHFALGTRQHTVIAHLDYSLQQILTIGVEQIQHHAQVHVNHLKEELPQMGFDVFTPAESNAPLVTCVYKNAREKLGPIFREEGLNLTVSPHSFRISVSVFNNHHDIEHLLRTLKNRALTA